MAGLGAEAWVPAAMAMAGWEREREWLQRNLFQVSTDLYQIPITGTKQLISLRHQVPMMQHKFSTLNSGT